MTPIELAGKVEWEGGVLQAIDYGLVADDLDDSNPDLKSAWVNLCNAYKNFHGLLEDVESQLPDLEDFENE